MKVTICVPFSLLEDLTAYSFLTMSQDKLGGGGGGWTLQRNTLDFLIDDQFTYKSFTLNTHHASLYAICTVNHT